MTLQRAILMDINNSLRSWGHYYFCPPVISPCSSHTPLPPI